MKPDNELLQQYARSHSEDAFAELVRRHVNLVYSAALRQVGGDAHLARDAAQTVFADLARKAASLSSRASLTGWLYTSAHFAANKIVRTENRRRQREEQFMREPARHAASEADWEQLRPALDAVMHELNDTDREAVLLRYFENRAYAEVGAKLNLNENTARMRVDRALEKLRTLLAKRGVTTGAALAAVISANAVQTAPGTLVTTLASSSLAGASAGGFTLLPTLNALKFKIGAGALAVAGVAIVLTLNRNLHATPRVQNTSPKQQVAQAQAANEGVPDSPSADSTTNAGNHVTQPLIPGLAVSPADAAKTSMASASQTTNAPPNTNKVVIHLKIKTVSLSRDGLQALRPAWPGGDSGILTADQLKFVNRALKSAGNFSMTDSQITAFSGQKAMLSAESPVLVDGTNASIATIFGVTPYFLPEASVFKLSLLVALRAPNDDSPTLTDQSLVKTNEVSVSPGQTAGLQKEIPSGLFSPGNPQEEKELLVFVTPEIGELSEAPQPAPNQPGIDDPKLAKMDEAKNAVLALILYADKNQGQIPPTLAQAANYLNNGTAERIETDYDVIYSGPLTAITNPSQTILLREKQAWQGPNGKWLKCYGFADGHAQTVAEPNNDFEAYEKEHIVQPEN